MQTMSDETGHVTSFQTAKAWYFTLGNKFSCFMVTQKAHDMIQPTKLL